MAAKVLWVWCIYSGTNTYWFDSHPFCSPMVRIYDSHSWDPGSILGKGAMIWQLSTTFILCLVAISRGIVTLMMSCFLYLYLGLGSRVWLQYCIILVCVWIDVTWFIVAGRTGREVVKCTWSWARVRYRTNCWRGQAFVCETRVVNLT